MTIKWIPTEDIVYDQEPVNSVRKRAARLLLMLKRQVSDCPVDKVILHRITSQLHRMLKEAAPVIINEISVIHGSVLSHSDLVQLACSISGAVRQARRGRRAGICAATVPETDCWAYIDQLEPKEGLFGEVVRARFVCCNSVFAGTKVYEEIPLQRVKWWARQLGLLGSRYRPFPWHGYKQLYRASSVLRIRCFDSVAEICGAGVVPTVYNANRQLGASRSRMKVACPHGAQHECAACGVGFNQCHRSCNAEETQFELG